MLWGLYRTGVSGDYGYLIGQFTLAYLYGFHGCYGVGINIFGQSFNLRVEPGHLTGGENRPDTTSTVHVPPTTKGRITFRFLFVDTCRSAVACGAHMVRISVYPQVYTCSVTWWSWCLVPPTGPAIY